MEYCYSCMNKTNGSETCLKCGFNGKYECPSHHLKPGSILCGKYMIGKSIGEGGFGITYVGMDLNLERKVAIKEYFPSGIVTRTGDTDTITVFTGDSEKYFYEGRNKFINEAKALAKLNNLPGIVSVIDFFMENGTSYIVMEFIEGRPFKTILRDRVRMDSEEVFNMLRQLIQSLGEIHKLGIIHRDISPDNIMITDDSTIKLIDFGAARDVSKNKSLSIQLKPGYAPEEQYRTHGKQGAWTDVYAVCATMYRAITGTLPPEALERIREDTLMRPSQMGISINPHKEDVLMSGLSLYYEGRIKSMEDLYNGLYNNATVQTVNQTPIPTNTPNPTPIPPQYNYNTQEKPKTNTVMIAIIIALSAILVVAIASFVIFSTSEKDSSTSGSNQTQTTSSTNTPSTFKPAPTPINEVTAKSTMYVVNCQEWISLRETPSKSAARLAQIPLGAQVGFVENSTNGFYKVTYNGMVGYSLAEYLSDSPYTNNTTNNNNSVSSSTQIRPGDTLRVVNCQEWVSLRKEPSKSAERISKINLGETVIYNSEATNGFKYVWYNGVSGYVLSEYLAK